MVIGSKFGRFMSFYGIHRRLVIVIKTLKKVTKHLPTFTYGFRLKKLYYEYISICPPKQNMTNSG